MKCPYCNGTGEVTATVGALVAHRRKYLELSQEEASRKAGISRGQLANIETDRCDIPLKTLYRLADALESDVRDLWP